VGTSADGILIDQHLNRPEITTEIIGVCISFGEFGWRYKKAKEIPPLPAGDEFGTARSNA